MAPWQASTVQEKQVRFIQEWQRDLLSFSALCQPANGTSRKTDYKRVGQFRQD